VFWRLKKQAVTLRWSLSSSISALSSRISELIAGFLLSCRGKLFPFLPICYGSQKWFCDPEDLNPDPNQNPCPEPRPRRW
jgi:hypothetical protein